MSGGYRGSANCHSNENDKVKLLKSLAVFTVSNVFCAAFYTLNIGLKKLLLKAVWVVSTRVKVNKVSFRGMGLVKTNVNSGVGFLIFSLYGGKL